MPLFKRILISALCLLVSQAVYSQVPTANFTFTMVPSSGCAPVQVQFQATPTGAGYTYNWIGIPNAGSVPSPSRIYTAGGTYTVTLIVSNSSGQSQPVTKNIVVYDTPTVAFQGAPLTGCPPLNVSLNATGTVLGAPGAGTYTWITSQGITSGSPASVTFPTGAHDVTLQVTNSKGCSRSLKKNAYINVHPKPEVDFSTLQTTYCSAPTPNITFTSTILQNTAGPYTYSWDMGQAPNQFQNTANATKSYGPPQSATYPVTLVLTDANGCKDTMTKPAYIKIVDVNANFTGPTGACIGTPVVFTNTSTPGGTVADWDYGPGETPDLNQVQANVSHTFVTSGTKTIRMIAKSGPCADTVYKTITIHPQPTIDFTYSPVPPCPAPVSVTFNATGATNYQWNFGTAGGIQATGNGVSHTFNTCGFYTPTLYATDAHGCKDTLSKIEFTKIYCGEFEIKADPLKGCAPLTVDFSTTSSAWWFIPFYQLIAPYVSPPATFAWNFGVTGSLPSSSATPSYTYTNPGLYYPSVTITTANGCTFTDNIEIQVGTKPVAKFNVDTTVCAGSKITFNNTSTFPGYNGGYIEYDWIFGDGKGYTSVANPIYEYDTAGSFCARLIAQYNGCPDTFIQCNIVVDSPVAKAVVDFDCTNRLNVSFTNKSYGFTSHIWYFGDGPTSTSTQLHPVHTYPGYGNYTWMLVTFNATSGCSDTLEGSISLMQPTIVLTASDTTVCKGDKIHFNAVFVNPAYTTNTYEWYVNNILMTKDSAASYTRPFPQEGYYTVKVVMQDAMGCPNTLTKSNWVLVSKPAVNFSATPVLGCVPLMVNFTDNSAQVPAAAGPLTGAPLVNRYWEYASPLPGVTLPGPTASNTYVTAGAYDIKLIVTDASGCKDSLTKPGYINAHKPAADFFVADTAACIGEDVTFNNLTSTAVSAKWYFGDGDSSLLLSPNHAYKQVGAYTVTMIVTDQYGCKDTLVKPNHIVVSKPNAFFTIKADSIAVCPPLIDTFDATGSTGAFAYWWDFQGSSFHPVASTVIEAFTTPGKFKVTLIVADAAGCTDTAESNVYVLGYDGAFNYSPLIGCNPLEVTFNSTLNNIPSIIWDFNDGNTFVSSTSPVKHTYTTPGVYLPKIIMTDAAGCSSASLGTDTIRVDGAIPDFYHSPACEGYNIKFTDTSKGVFTAVTGWAWTFHTGQLGGGKSPTHYYPKAGTYPVTLVVTNANGCKDTLVRDIVVNNLPEISAGNDTVICLKDPAQLIATGGVSYVWSPATSLSCTNCPDPLATPTDTTEYIVIGTDANQCSDTDQVMVLVKYKVESVAGDGGEICDGETFNLKVEGARTYEWTPANVLDDPKATEPVATPSSNTKFMVVAFEGSCIPDTNFVDVVVHPRPTVQASGGTTIIAGKEAPLNAEGKLIHTFLWKPSATLDCDDCPNPIARPIKTTVYTIVARTQYGCEDSASVEIKVLCDQSQLFIPNTFTPNSDGQNDMFYPRGTGFDNLKSFRVFNRWGEVVFEKRNFALNDKASGWDGTFRGQDLPPDVFMYTVDADCDNGEVIQWKGDVTLIR